MTIGSKIIYHANVSSTNETAQTLISSGSAADGTVISAGFQTKGKGQRKNRWYSEPFMNLIMSVILFPEKLAPENQFYLSKIVSLAVLDALGRYSDNIRIKWPNDIYYKGDKIAGILIENSVLGEKISSCIAGIGVNINQEHFPEDIPNPVSLYQIKGKRHNVQLVQDEVCKQLQYWYTELKASNFMSIDQAYTRSLYMLGKETEFETKDALLRGTITGVNNSGQLKITDSDGKRRVFAFREIEFSSRNTTSR